VSVHAQVRHIAEDFLLTLQACGVSISSLRISVAFILLDFAYQFQRYITVLLPGCVYRQGSSSNQQPVEIKKQIPDYLPLQIALRDDSAIGLLTASKY